MIRDGWNRNAIAGCVVSITKQWVKGGRPLRISVLVTRPTYSRRWTAEEIAAALVERACLLLHCRPRDLKLRSSPADGLIRAVRKSTRLQMGYRSSEV